MGLEVKLHCFGVETRWLIYNNNFRCSLEAYLCFSNLDYCVNHKWCFFFVVVVVVCELLGTDWQLDPSMSAHSVVGWSPTNKSLQELYFLHPKSNSSNMFAQWWCSQICNLEIALKLEVIKFSRSHLRKWKTMCVDNRVKSVSDLSFKLQDEKTLICYAKFVGLYIKK